MALLSRFFGRTASEGAAFALGTATGPVLGPAVQELRNQANQLYQARPIDAGTLAAGVAQGQVDPGWAKKEAQNTGINGGRFDRLVAIANVGPGMASAFDLWRRDVIDVDRFKAALRRGGIEQEWIDDLVKVKDVLLSPAEVAAAVQQGHLPNPNILPDVSPAVPAVGGQVQADSPDGAPPSAVPLTTIDIPPIDEASGSGVDLERLKVIANLAGLPPGSAELLTLWNRELIDEASVDAGLREGHLKTKWSQAYKRLRWNVLGAAEYAGLHLRGWIDADEMYKGGKLTGHTKDQMDKLYLNRGRPMAPVQAFTAWARGAPHPEGLGYTKRPGTFDEEDFLRALKQSDVRTEYGPVLWHNRFAYPPLFQLGRLAQAGAIDEPRAREILKFERYEPQDIDRLADFWYRGAQTATVNTVEKLATTQARASLKRRFMTERIDSAGVLTGLELLGSTPAEAGHVLEMWTLERGWIDKPLTPTQIKSAYTRGILTIDEAIAELARQGYSPGTAAALLGTVAPALTTAEIQARIEDDVRNGVVDASEAIDRLKAIGFSTKDAAALVASLTG